MFNSQDKVMIIALKKILDEATFPLKKREVQSFAMIMTWVNELEKRINTPTNVAPQIAPSKKKKVGL